MTPEDEADARQREESLAETVAALQTVLFNQAGLERLLTISDEEWQQVQHDDDANEA